MKQNHFDIFTKNDTQKFFSPYQEQKSIQRSIVFQGVGIHSGKEVLLKLIPAPVHTGIYFFRTDVDPLHAHIPATWSKVSNTKMCTKLTNEYDVSIGTVEHLMAACAGLGLDNLRIEVNGAEIPIMDGSSDPFIKGIERVGLIDQEAYRRYIKILKNIKIEERETYISLSPAENFEISFNFDIKKLSKKVEKPSQQMKLIVTDDAFKTEIASARTLGIYEEVNYLRAAGLALGGSLENVVVLKEGEVLNPEGLRFTDEFVRHKILDVIGDLYLAGSPIIGSIEAVDSGHSLNNLLMRKLFSDPSFYEYIYKPLDHSYPLMSDYFSSSKIAIA